MPTSRDAMTTEEAIKAAKEKIQRVAATLTVLHEDKEPIIAATISAAALAVSADIDGALDSLNEAISALSAKSQEQQAPVVQDDAKNAIKAIHSVCWWHQDGYPVFNNSNGDDLILRKEALAALASHPAPAPSEDAKDTDRLNHLEANPHSVVYSTGYLGAADSWAWRDSNGATYDAKSLRAAIDAAIAAQKE